MYLNILQSSLCSLKLWNKSEILKHDVSKTEEEVLISFLIPKWVSRYFEKKYESRKVNRVDIENGMLGNKDTGNVNWHSTQRRPPPSEKIWQLWVVITFRETGLVMSVSVSSMKLFVILLFPLVVSSQDCRNCRPDTACCSESVCANNPTDDNGYGKTYYSSLRS